MTYHLPIATVVSVRSDDPAFRQAMRNLGYVQGFGATEPAGLQRKGGRLLVLSEGAGDAGLELERQIGEVLKKRGRKSLLAPSKKWSSKTAKFGGEGKVLQVDFDENDIAAADLAASLRARMAFQLVEPNHFELASESKPGRFRSLKLSRE